MTKPEKPCGRCGAEFKARDRHKLIGRKAPGLMPITAEAAQFCGTCVIALTPMDFVEAAAISARARVGIELRGAILDFIDVALAR